MKRRIIGSGNNDGDRFIIEQIDPNRIYLRIDQCCVSLFDGIIPNEILVAIIAEFLMKNNGDIITGINCMDGNEEYKDMLKQKLT